MLNKYVESLYQNTFFIGFAFLMTGVLLFAADRMGHGNKMSAGLRWATRSWWVWHR